MLLWENACQIPGKIKNLNANRKRRNEIHWETKLIWETEGNLDAIEKVYLIGRAVATEI